MSALERRETRGIFPELFDWIESPFTAFRTGTGQAMRVENYVDEGDHVIRAELPGIDPDKDIEITVTGGVLRIHAERHEEKREGQRSEFRYGSFTRSFTLPAATEIDDIKAYYDKGILIVRVPMPKAAKAEAKRITVEK
ncbi:MULTISPECIES: Hsp20/alpha crystallin family protein [Actinomadura]|uniref:Hsp20/alpha crystallin family protein n=1 Tax=Actinomadura geliboluensis TaxID=882440 RepID=A0A5S4HCC6_9ACTN|nr:Hsp20/alpha crystallin family protein [Actinomadura geliboluensis]TMR42411.1 Hsp20/alpha crystallin family protein [Actinomadura geliboluensis]